MQQKFALKVFTNEEKHDLGDLFGIFFEDLNHAADGGLYAELVRNRSFEFDPIDRANYHPLIAWEKVEQGAAKINLHVEKDLPLNDNNQNYLTLDVEEVGDRVGVKNLGYNSGIPVKKEEKYLFSFYARTKPNSSKDVQITLESADGKSVYATENIRVNSSEWTKYKGVLNADDTDLSSRLVLTTKQTGKIYLDMVSLFPKNTYKGRKNGLRKDIAEKLAELKPKFMRFPGGCLVHDGSLNENDRNSMYRWKNTIGNIEERPARRNNWGYNQTFGLGYYEYFLLCEDIGAKPIPILPAGYDPHHHRIIPIDELQPWIDDALDLIEFANGDTTTEWGKKRAEFGHPEPFNLEYIGIGNEEVGEPFFERYKYFHKAIREKYPEIKIINTSGPFAAGSEYERGWQSAKENHSDFVDEHYYMAPEWFLANYDRYDDFKADDPKVFLGEYATWGNTYYNALVEAAYMTGLEKNAHAVGLACYAPMLCNVDYVNWSPNLIWFDNHRVYGTPNYYVQKLFMHHQGDRTVQVDLVGDEVKNKPINQPITGGILVGDVGDVDNTSRYYDIKIKNNDTGEEKIYENCVVEDGHVVVLDDLDWTNFEISLKAKKLSGGRGFKIYFGHTDQKNRLFWELGGWQNQDSVICAVVNGRNSCLTQSLFTVEIDQEYYLKLKVSGRHIQSFIDGKLINEAEDKLPVIEPLYYSASIEDVSGDVIVKVINVQDEPVSTQLILDGLANKQHDATIYQLAGYGLEEVNSLDSPENIVPVEKEITLNDHVLEYEFPKHSVTIIRIRN